MLNRSPLLFLLCLLVASAFVYLIGNGSVSLWDRDEPRYAETSRQMLQTGDWVVPHYLDKPRTAKPAFIYWCQASAMKVFDDNEFAARFPSAIAMLILVAVLFVVLNKHIDPQHARWTVFIFATSGLIIAAAKMCITDAVLLLWVTIGQLCLYAIYRGDSSWPVVMTLAVAIGLGGLTKGPVILGIEAMTFVALGALNLLDRIWQPELKIAGVYEDDLPDDGTMGYRRIRPVPSPQACKPAEQVLLKSAAAVAVVVAIVLPWILLVNYRASGFILLSLKLNVWDRMMTPLEQHSGPPGYYFLTVWLTYFPWSLLLPLAIGLAFRYRSEPRTRFALAAILGPWIMLECVRTKLPHYFLPVFPPLAFLTGDALVRAIRGQIDDLLRKSFVIPVCIWALLVTAAASASWVVQYNPLPHGAMLAMSVFGGLFGLLVAISFLRRRVAIGAMIMGLGTFGFVAIVYGLYLPNADYLRLSPRVAKILNDHHVTQPGQVIMLDYMEPSLAFAQGGTIREAGSIGFSKKFEPQMPPWLVVTKTIWDKAPQSLRDDFEIIGQELGLAYADHGKWLTVMVIRRKP